MAAATLLNVRAQVGGEARDVRFEFLCSSDAPNATGALIMNLIVSRHAELRPALGFDAFDFDALEGPAANAGVRTGIQTEGAPGRFAVSGWIGVVADQPFVFGLSAAWTCWQRRRGSYPRLSRACVASTSARSFIGLPLCPRTQSHSTSCGLAAASRRCQSS